MTIYNQRNQFFKKLAALVLLADPEIIVAPEFIQPNSARLVILSDTGEPIQDKEKMAALYLLAEKLDLLYAEDVFYLD